MKKHTRNIDSLINEEKNRGATKSISEACIDYMKLEHAEKVSTVEENLTDHVQQRLRTGKAAVLRISDVTEKEKRGYSTTVIRGNLDYSNLPYSNPGKILSALRLKDNEGSGSGSFVRGIPINGDLEKEFDYPGVSKLRDCPAFFVDEISISNSEVDESGRPVTGEIVLESIDIYRAPTEFKLRGNMSKRKSDENDLEEITTGDALLIDEAVTDFQKESAYYALKNSEYSSLASVLEDMRRGEANNTTDRFSKTRIEEFTEWMQNENSRVLPVNDEQQQFIEDVTSKISLLQGPPGTGKTSGGVAPAIVGRLLAKDDGVPCRTLVTGASNKSINEVMVETVELIDAYKKSELTGDELDDVLIHRAAQKPDSLADAGLTNVPYETDIAFTKMNDGDQYKKHKDKIENRLNHNKNKLNADGTEHIISFATARSAWKIGKKDNIIEDFAFDDENDSVTKEPTEIQKDKHGLFDVIVADEASMMNVPLFLLTGSFYDGDGNIILSGDHRQLPPVSEYEWENDYKPSIRHKVPYISALDFFRLLSGDDVKSIDEDHKDLVEITTGAEPDIPLHQLTKTYRCHETTAAFLEKWVYQKLDDIEYISTQTDTINPYKSGIPSIDETLRSEKALTVITYDDTKHQQTNDIEASIATELLKTTRQETTTGIVTPHNAQRALLESKIDMNAGEINSNPDVDTVERFQGGERDLMIVSGTVSDPDYIKQEEKFLLSLNRLNVAMSRMKKKLVVIASESIFDHIPQDTDDYDNALLWKGLATETGLSENKSPAWNGKLHEIINMKQVPNTVDASTNVKVYHTDMNE